MEALQLLKYGYKKERLHFTEHLITTEEDMMGPGPGSIGTDFLAKWLRLKGESGTSVKELFNWGDNIF